MGRISTRTGKPVDSPAEKVEAKSRGKMAFQAAAKSAEFFDHLRAHYRETRRTPVDIKAKVRIVMEDGTVFDEGHAVIKDVSPSGALLSEVSMKNGVYPAKRFKMELLLESGEYRGIGIEAVPVRFVAEDFGLGVKFEEIFVSA
jgi:hypothetical protein